MHRLNTKTRLTMLCLSGFELYSRWVPLVSDPLQDMEFLHHIYCPCRVPAQKPETEEHPRSREVLFFCCIGNMRNFLDLKKQGAQGGPF